MTIWLKWRYVLNKLLGDAMKVFLGGRRIPLNQRACLAELEAESVVLLGASFSFCLRALGLLLSDTLVKGGNVGSKIGCRSGCIVVR
jgi:hypothetical protein